MKKFIVANWKMNPQTLDKAKALFDSVARGIDSVKDTEVVICPPFIYLAELIAVLASQYKIQNTKYKIQIGGQDCFYEDKGAFTGEISAVMLKSMGCKYVILGHSERRKYQQETNETISKKTESALSAGLKPIVCVDNLSQLENLKNIARLPDGQENLIIAYEPLECIGNGNACDPKKAEKMRILIEKKISRSVQILYGGSVNSQNAKDYVKTAGFSGLLIGGVSLKADEFVKVANTLIYS